MHSTDDITLQLTVSGIDAYCRDLARHSPTVEKRVAAIDALITFISSQTNAGLQAQPQYVAIKQILLDHFEQARSALLEERAQRLLQAMQKQNLSVIAALYTSLSREAFWTLLGRIEQQLDSDALASLRTWASGWMVQARQRAMQSSPYPDAIDFDTAGIDPSEYLAMSDLCRYLGIDSARL